MATDITAPWIWQDLESAASVTTVTADDLAQIRKLVVYWDTAENGAAGLADGDFFALDDDGDHLSTVVDIFLNTATLPQLSGTIINRYADADKGDISVLLGDVPDAEIRAILMFGEDIEFKATEQDRTLWTEANLRGSGIDPKRPFGSENVSRQIRPIIDPEKTLPKKQFIEHLRRVESRMMLMLQFFVQNAQLEPGSYMRDSSYTWLLVADGEADAENLTRVQWSGRMYDQMWDECIEYTKTLQALIHLVWENRLAGTYGQLAEQFKLGTHFDSGRYQKYTGTIEERFQAALAYFPERRGETERPWFTLSYVRLLNAAARFEEARQVLEKADLFDIAASDVDLTTVNPLGVALLESLVTKRGLEIIDDSAFQDIISGAHREWQTKPVSIWSFVWDTQYYDEKYSGDADSPGVKHAQAVTAQIQLMRGGYIPE